MLWLLALQKHHKNKGIEQALPGRRLHTSSGATPRGAPPEPPQSMEHLKKWHQHNGAPQPRPTARARVIKEALMSSRRYQGCPELRAGPVAGTDFGYTRARRDVQKSFCFRQEQIWEEWA